MASFPSSGRRPARPRRSPETTASTVARYTRSVGELEGILAAVERGELRFDAEQRATYEADLATSRKRLDAAQRKLARETS